MEGRPTQARRDASIERLKDAYVRGALTLDDMESRVGWVLTAPTQSDLVMLTSDVPGETAVLPRTDAPIARSAALPVVAAVTSRISNRERLLWIVALGLVALLGLVVTEVAAHYGDLGSRTLAPALGPPHHNSKPSSLTSGNPTHHQLVYAKNEVVAIRRTGHFVWRSRELPGSAGIPGSSAFSYRFIGARADGSARPVRLLDGGTQMVFRYHVTQFSPGAQLQIVRVEARPLAS